MTFSARSRPETGTATHRFVNPYNFARPTAIPLDRAPARGWHRDDEREALHSGAVVCELINESPLFLPAGEKNKHTSTGSGQSVRKSFSRRESGDGAPLIPGTSLKGMLRTLAETIAGGCSPFGFADTDSALTRCEHPGSLCACCRIFGYMQYRGRGLSKGRIAISDAIRESGPDPERVQVHLPRMGQPDPHHYPFYLDAAGRPRGRKFYWHHPDVHSVDQIPGRLARPAPHGVSIHPLPPGAMFTFSVRWSGLTDDELGLLLWSLFPGERFHHKLGYGKALGLGTVRIRVREGTVAPDPASRWSDFDAPPPRPIRDFVVDVQRRFSTRSAARLRQMGADLPEESYDDLWLLPDPALEDLSLLLRPDALPSGVPIRYPSDGWFRTHASHPLPTAVETVRQRLYLPE